MFRNETETVSVVSGMKSRRMRSSVLSAPRSLRTHHATVAVLVWLSLAECDGNGSVASATSATSSVAAAFTPSSDRILVDGNACAADLPISGVVSAEAPRRSVGTRTVRLPNAQGTRLRIFYPTTDRKDGPVDDDDVLEFAPYFTDGRRPGLGVKSFLAPKDSGCMLDAPLLAPHGSGSDVGDVSASETDWPMLLYSHSIGSNIDSAVSLFRSLASHGVIVGALEHTDGTCSPYTTRPNGRALRYSEYLMTDRQKLARRAGELLEAATWLPGELAQWKQLERDSITSSKDEAKTSAIFRTPIALGGQGLGAAAAVMAANGASEECNVGGLLLHDPTLGMGYGMLPPNGAGQSGLPTITYVSDQARRAGTLYGTRTIHVRGAKKGRGGSFTDAPLWGSSGRRSLSPIGNLISADPVQIHEELVRSMTAFLRTLRSSTGNAVSPEVSDGSLFEVIR